MIVCGNEAAPPRVAALIDAGEFAYGSDRGRNDMTGQGASDLAKIAEADGGVVSPEQTLILFALVARHGFAPQNDLGVPMDAADREALMRAELVKTLKREQNVLWLSLTDAGWDWAGANLTKALPASYVVLHHMMARIGEHLGRTGETLRELVGDPPKPGKMDAEMST